MPGDNGRTTDDKWWGGCCVKMLCTYRDRKALFVLQKCLILYHLGQRLLSPSPYCCRQTISYFCSWVKWALVRFASSHCSACRWGFFCRKEKTNGIMDLILKFDLFEITVWLFLIDISVSIEFCSILIFRVARQSSCDEHCISGHYTLEGKKFVHITLLELTTTEHLCLHSNY